MTDPEIERFAILYKISAQINYFAMRASVCNTAIIDNKYDDFELLIIRSHQFYLVFLIVQQAVINDEKKNR